MLKRVIKPDAELDISEFWAKCWDDVLRLPIEPLTNRVVNMKAELLVQNCRASAGDDGVEWFLRQLGDGLLFVVEQLAGDPDSVEWQRIHAALSGARAGLFGEMKIASVIRG